MQILSASFFSKSVFILGVLFYSTSQFANLDQAKQLIKNGNTEAALEALEAELSASPSPEAEFLRAVTLQSLGKRDLAISAYANMVQNYPELPEPYNNLAVMHAEDKNYEKAVQMLERAILTNRSYATAYENLGDIYSQQASAAYTDALSLNPPNSKTVELKLNLIDNILLPPNMRKPVMAAANDTPTSNRPVSNGPATSTPTTNPNEGIVSAGATQSTQAGTTISSADEQVIKDTVNNWARAWSEQNTARYLNYYADGFKPNRGLSRANWAQSRRVKLTQPSFINVAITNISIAPSQYGATATFTQNYQSDNYEDTVIKSLYLVRTNTGWKIRREISKPL